MIKLSIRTRETEISSDTERLKWYHLRPALEKKKGKNYEKVLNKSEYKSRRE